ncbi:hypothetical protein AGMMS50262_09480 [Bacteroidia bacterium]|nr:hypothetical protein AGMMS50262_09480 [Bacteroidia bacterium]
MAKKITFYLLICVMSIVSQAVFAVPAVPWPVEKVQPDGKKVSVYLRGDEKVHWLESLDGYTLMYDAQKYVVYAEQDGQGNLVPSKTQLGKGTPAKAIEKGLRYSQSQIAQLQQIWKITEDGKQQKAFLGEKKALCVLVGFTNKPFTKTIDEFTDLMNQVGYTTGGAKGSVKDFYLENSYGKLDLTVTVVGTYSAPNTTSYYASHQREFALFALDAADPDVDYNDFAVDGKLETFHIIFAGYGDENIGNDQQIWSHKWQLASPVTRDGVQISVYSCSPELRGASGTNITYIGVVAHELGHVFGSPDYYDTSYSGYPGTGNWDIMAGGSWNDNGRQPAHVNPLQKIIYGWITPTELTDETQITDMPASAFNPVVYTIQANSNGEEYILENKQKVGFDASLPGNGLLIWHIHQSARDGHGSNSGHPQQLYPVCAAATVAIPTSTASSYGPVNTSGTPFPGTTGKNTFTDTTVPQAFTWSGLAGIGKPVTDITEADGKISFGFLKGIVKDPVTDLQSAVDGGKVTLTWTAPANDEVLGYNIYRNDVLQYAIAGKANTSYIALNVTNGTYTYAVSAKYALAESDKETVEVTVTGGSDAVCLPVTNLKASAGVDKVNLTWKAPFSGGWVGISGNYSTAYTIGEEWDSFQGTLWSPEDLVGLEGYKISKVKFVPYENGATYAIAIYQVPESGDPELIYTQPIESSSLSYGNAYNEITLTTPVEYDPSKGLIIGTQIHTLGGYYLSVSDGEQYPGRNIFYDVDGWVAFEDLGIPLGRNYCLQAYLDGASGAPVLLKSSFESQKANTSFLQKAKAGKQLKAVAGKINTGLEKAPATITKYIIYRDGVEIGDTTSPSYEDATVTQETTYSYCVSVVYDNACTSEAVCVETTTLKPINPNKPVENLKAKASLTDVKLTWDAPYSGGIIGYSSSTIDNAYRGSLDFSMAARFSIEDVQKYAGMQLSEVTFGTYPSSAAGVNPSTVAYTIRVWTGGNADGPAQLVYEQPVPTYINGWNTVTLTTPVTISGSEELWIGLHAVKLGADTGVYPATVDAGPAVVGKGDMIYIDGAWTSWSTYTGSANENWTILGKVGYADESGAPAILSAIPYETVVTAKSVSSVEKVSTASVKNVAAATSPQLAAHAPASYKVERDGVEIAEVTQASYTDNTVAMITAYDYCVKAVYSNPIVSQTTIFSQDFESSVAGWLVNDADGDANNWGIYTGAAYAHSGSRFAMSYSYNGSALTPDNWLISPAITLTDNNTLEYYVSAFNTSYAAEHYGVYISTTNTSLSSFTLLSEETMTAVSGNNVKGNRDLSGPEYAQGSWKQRTIDLSTYAGQTVYIAFRHFNCSDEYALLLDDISIIETTTTYETGVSDPVCVAVETENPYKPVATLDAKVVAYDVSLNWTVEDASSGNGTVLLEEGFEGGSTAGLPTGWTSVDADGDGFTWYQLNTNDNSALIPHGGIGFATSASYQSGVLYPDNWLISPAVTLTSDNTLEYYVNAQDAAWAAEHYGVYISTTNTSTSSFTLLKEETLTAVAGNKVSGKVSGDLFRVPDAPEHAQGAWYQKTIDLSTYAGQTVYIAFRHFNCSDWFRINIDDVKITAPESAGDNPYVPAFNVYDNDELIAEGISETTLELTDVAVGSHTYSVKALYTNGTIETAAKSKTVAVVELGDAHRPVSNLSATTWEHEGTFTWETPKYAEKYRYHTYESGTHSNIGTSSAADFDIAARFTPEQLQSADGLLLTKVRFIPVYDKAITTYSIRVWQGGSWSDEARDAGTLLVDQVVTSQTVEAWNDIALDTPVSIDPTKELWIGVRCNTTTGHPAAMQMPGAIEGRGNLMFFQGSWATATELGATLNGNWIIDGIAAYHQGLDAAPIQLSALPDVENRTSTGKLSATEGFVQPSEKAAPVLPEVVKYEISRDDAVIGETTELGYFDTVDASGTYTYTVKAIYEDEVSSPAVELNVTYVSECDNAPEEVTAERAANEVNLAWDYTPVVIPPGGTPQGDIDVLFLEDFNAGLPADWTTIDADGDGQGWYLEDYGDGDGYMSSDSWSLTTYEALTPDNWLVSPQIDLRAGSRLSYNVWSYPYLPEEHYGVFVSTTDTDPSSFTLLFEETLTGPTGAQAVSPIQKVKGLARPQLIPEGSQSRVIDLSAYAGKTVYLAFRHFNCTDILWMTIDDVKVEAPKVKAPAKFNIYQNDEKIAESTLDVKTFATTLTEAGKYAFGVSYVGSTGCESAITYTDSISFKPVSFTAFIADKVYDGKTAAVVDSIAFAGLDADTALVAGTDYTVESAVFADRNAGEGKNVTVTIGFDNLASEYYLAKNTIVSTGNITPKTLIVKGLKASNKVYDATTDVVVSGFPTLNGKVSGDDVILSGDLEFAFVDVNVADSVAVVISGLELDGEQAGNYTLELPEISAKITPASLVIMADFGQSKIYGEVDPELTYNIIFGQLFGEDTFSGALGRTEGEHVYYTDSDPMYEITIGDLSVSDNYTLTLVSGIEFRINPATLLITADNSQKVYGDTDPELTYVITGWKFDDTADLLVGELAREEGENVGTYRINLGDLLVSKDYSLIMPQESIFTITPATLTVTPDADLYKKSGDEDPALTYTSEGWKFDDTDALLTGELTREPSEEGGLYEILLGTLAVANDNYVIDFVSGVTFNIWKTGIADVVTASGLKVYPNPVKVGVPFTVVTATSDAKIQIFNLSGVLVKQLEAISTKTDISLGQPGVYIISVGAERAKIDVR